jgi:dihydropteroate synthase
MGILNVTPDSFSDGCEIFDEPARALARAHAMVEAGAALLDVGGESTRPGAALVSPDEELRRVLPVIEALVRELPVPVSVDTRKAAVARAAIAAGAAIVNDVSGLAHDPGFGGWAGWWPRPWPAWCSCTCAASPPT